MLLDKIVTKDQLSAMQIGEPSAALWTALIPAAGKGSRLGYELPKILYPIKGKTILEYLVEKLSRYCQQFVFVLSPEGEKIVQPHLEKLLPGRYRIAVQTVATGMGDAVNRAQGDVITPYTMVLWGDQVAINQETIRKAMWLHENDPKLVFSMPTYLRPKPYIHFTRDEKNHLTGVLQQREGDVMPSEGESDCGMFLFNTSELFSILNEHWEDNVVLGKATHEVNFLPFLKFFERRGKVCVYRIVEEWETIGVNTKDDANSVSPFLKE